MSSTAHSRLLAFGRPEIENLHRQLGCRSAIVVLFDLDGAVLGAAGEPGFVARALAVEARGRPLPSAPPAGLTLTRLERSHHLECITAPVCAPEGGLIGQVGIVDLADRRFLGAGHAMALLQTAADMIEHRLIEHLDNGYLTLRFHDRPALIDSAFDAVMVFDDDGRLVASNRIARSGLDLGEAADGVRCETCFAIGWPRLVGWANLAQPRPFPLRSRTGHTFNARATLRTRPHFRSMPA